MSGIFQGYANSDGRVRMRQVSKLPAWSSRDRGMVVSYPDRVATYLLDAGQPRVFHDGIAFDNVTGLLLATTVPFGSTSISMGGLQVDSRGAVILADKVGDVIHQGVGLTNEGALAIEEIPLLTVPKSVVITGDSFAAQDKPRLDSSTAFIPSNSHFFWANSYSWSRLWVKGNATDDLAGYQGVGGDTTAEVLARIGTATGLSPDYIWVQVGLNDVVSDIAASVSISNYESIVTAITGAGAVPILVTLPPSNSVNTAARQQAYEELNAWIRSQVGVAIIGEQSDAYRDPDAPFANPLPEAVFDGVHTNATGAEAAGAAISESLSRSLQLVDPFDTYTEIYPNRYMLGTGGSATNGVSGSVPDSFTMTTDAVSTLQCSASKIERSLEEGEWARVEVRRSADDPATGTRTMTTNYTANIPLSGSFAVGTLASVVMEIFPEPGQKNFRGVRLMVRQVGATRQWVYAPTWTSASDLSGLPLGDYKSMVVSTPVLKIEPGTTSLNLFLQVFMEEGEGAVSCNYGRHCIIPYPPYV